MILYRYYKIVVLLLFEILNIFPSENQPINAATTKTFLLSTLDIFAFPNMLWRYLDRIIRENWSPILYRRQAKVAAITIHIGLAEFVKIVH